MKINRNMSAVMTNKQLLRTENRLQASMARLSSGFKINSAGENPAGKEILFRALRRSGQPQERVEPRQRSFRRQQ